MLQRIIESIRDIISLFTIYLTFLLPLSIGYKELFNKISSYIFGDNKEDNKENKLDNELWRKLVEEMIVEPINEKNDSDKDVKYEEDSLMDIINKFNEVDNTENEEVVKTTT
tara:strand:+ start:141 stop:476 length:336 start_codon:yes stop_codon:yes gene_type:complete